MNKKHLNYWFIGGILSIAICSGILVGYVTAIIAGALPLLTEQFHLDNLNQGLLVSVILIGGFLGSLLCGNIATALGHKKTLILVSGIFILSSLWSAGAQTFWSLFCARFSAGLAVGMSTVIAPMYVAETTPDSLRGFLVGSVQLAITFGILLAYILGFYLAPDNNWPLMFGLGAIPAIVLFLVTLTQLESPHWMLLKNKVSEAKEIFFKLHGQHWQEDKKTTTEHASSFKALLSPKLLPAILFSSGLFVFQNLSGIDAILYYAPTIFQQAGFQGLEGSLRISILLGVINIIATLLSMWLLDSVGRRPVLLYGLLMMAISLTGFSFSQVFLTLYPITVKWFSLCMLLVFVASFALSMGPIPYVIMSELFPLRIRSLCVSIASATSWGINALITFAFPVLESWLGMHWLFAGFAFVCILAYITSIIFCPETKGQSLESIETKLLAGAGLRNIGK